MSNHHRHPSDVPCVTLTGKFRGKVYQNTSAQFANGATPSLPRLQVRANPPQRDPKTPRQILWRGLMRPVTFNWFAITPEWRAIFARDAKADGSQSAYHSYMKQMFQLARDILPDIQGGGG